MTDHIIQMRLPADQKARWVRESRAAGMRLTDWITRAVEAQMQQQKAHVIIPDDVQFSDLNLSRRNDGTVSFDWSPIERICAASGLDIALLRDGPESNIAGLISTWYMIHIAHGGERDAVQDELIAEVNAEDAHGQKFSHQPGRA